MAVREGDFAPGASSGRPAVVIAGSDEYVVVVEASEFDVANVRKSSPTLVYVEAVSSTPIAGVILADPIIKRPRDQTNREAVFEFESLLTAPPPTGSLAGMSARVDIELAKKTAVPLVPLNAVFSEGGTNYLLTRTGHVLKAVPVVLGLSDDSEIEVIGGVKADMTVMTGSQTTLRLKAWPSR